MAKENDIKIVKGRTEEGNNAEIYVSRDKSQNRITVDTFDDKVYLTVKEAKELIKVLQDSIKDKLAEYGKIHELIPDKNKVIIEAELSDSQIEALNDKNINISEPFSTNVAFDYGNEVVYCAGKVQSFYETEKNQKKKKPERNQEIERE
jgi:hypothetical protein